LTKFSLASSYKKPPLGEGSAAKQRLLNKEIDAQKDKINTLKAALENAATSFGENDRRTDN
jgi:uncharacterized membrane protein